MKEGRSMTSENNQDAQFMRGIADTMGELERAFEAGDISVIAVTWVSKDGDINTRAGCSEQKASQLMLAGAIHLLAFKVAKVICQPPNL
jgi:hypothetical protein